MVHICKMKELCSGDTDLAMTTTQIAHKQRDRQTQGLEATILVLAPCTLAKK